MVDCGPDQGRSRFETGSVAPLRRKKMNGYAIISKEREHGAGPQDANPEWTLNRTYLDSGMVTQKIAAATATQPEMSLEK
jgi:hypothetical protein